MPEEFNPRTIKIVIGLGNPGTRYANTYHNVGAEAISYLRKNAGKEALGKCRLFVAWEQSRVYMNESGIVVKKSLRRLGLKSRDLLVLHDDSDIGLGNSKYSFGRGAAGHKGIESVTKNLGTNAFWRFRIGIRKETEGGREKAGEFVLKKITARDKVVLERVFKEDLLARFTAGTETRS